VKRGTKFVWKALGHTMHSIWNKELVLLAERGVELLPGVKEQLVHSLVNKCLLLAFWVRGAGTRGKKGKRKGVGEVLRTGTEGNYDGGMALLGKYTIRQRK